MTDFGKRAGLIYVDRGDPSSSDFTEDDLTTDGDWHELDLSSIIPAGAFLAHIISAIEDTSVNLYMQFQETGNTNNLNVLAVKTYVSGIYSDLTGLVLLDSDRKCEYRFSNTTINNIIIAIRGWFI
jgi:hypothetical protein